jgi:endonuclease-8
MSEGPEVKIIAKKICKAICGKKIDKIHCKSNIDNEFANKIISSYVRRVETYGKNLVIVFSSGVYLRNHMLMWGKWRIYDRQEFEEGKSEAPLRSKFKRMIRRSSGNSLDDKPITNKIEYTDNSTEKKVIDVRNDSRVRLIIFTKDKVAVQFNGPILKFSFENPANLEPIVNLGPDPLRSDFSVNDVDTRLNQRIKDNGNTLIADLLLDQKLVAGIGNKYKSEILFLSKLNPFLHIRDISPKSSEMLLQQIPSVLNTAYRNSGDTRIVRNSLVKRENNRNNTRRWSDKHWVFRRSGRPCWNCGTQIVTDHKLSTRVTFWCPNCQKQSSWY